MSALRFLWRKKKAKGEAKAEAKAEEPKAVPTSPEEWVRALNHGDGTEVIGRGNFGTVYLVDCGSEQRAIKRVSSIASGAGALERADKEDAILRSLRHHANVVRFFGSCWIDTAAYFVFEYVAGGEMFDWVLACGATGVGEAAAKCVLKQILAAIRHLHSMGIVHRDIKPENVFVSARDPPIAKLGDFGLAARWKPGDELMTMQCGSLEYVAPEILRDDPYDSAVDIWSFGILGYVALTGCLPFCDEDDNAATAHAICTLDATWPKNRLPSPGAADVVDRATQKFPRDRPSADELAAHPWFADEP